MLKTKDAVFPFKNDSENIYVTEACILFYYLIV